MQPSFQLTPQRAKRGSKYTDPEAAIVRGILSYLAICPDVAWAHRFNTGAHAVHSTDARGRPSKRFVRYAFPGCSDILGQLVGGHFLAVECKRKGAKLSDQQAAFLARVNDAGGVGVRAEKWEDVEIAISRHQLRNHPP